MLLYTGINIRHLGLVRLHVQYNAHKVGKPANHYKAADILLVEMVKRTLKNIARLWLRDVTNAQESSDYLMKQTVVRFLNLISGSHKQTKQFWSKKVWPGINKRFGTFH